MFGVGYAEQPSRELAWKNLSMPVLRYRRAFDDDEVAPTVDQSFTRVRGRGWGEEEVTTRRRQDKKARKSSIASRIAVVAGFTPLSYYEDRER